MASEEMVRVASIGLWLAFGAGCAAPGPAVKQASPRPPDAVAGCDTPALRAMVGELGGRVRSARDAQLRVPVGEPRSERLRRCRVGEAFEACLAHFARPGHHVWVSAVTRYENRLAPVANGAHVPAELAALVAHDDRFELGQNVRERVIADGPVCVREHGLRTVRVPRLRARDADPLALLRTRRDRSDRVIELGRRGRFEVRCAARDEVVRVPELTSSGACSSLAGQTLTHALATR